MKKTIIMGFLWSMTMFSMMIRVALSVVAPALMQIHHISPRTMGYVLSGWNWSLTAGLLFSGPIVDSWGPWISMAVGSTVWGIFTIALPIAGTALSLFLMRLIFGAGQSILIPTTTTSVLRNFDSRERATAMGTALSGGVVGSAIGATVTAFIVSRAGWSASFYWLGGGSVVLSLLWFLVFPDKVIGRVSPKPANEPSVSWFSLLRYRSTWGISFGLLGYLYAYFFFVSWLPGYLMIERHMAIMKSGIVASLPFWMGMIGTLGGGWLSDFLTRRGVSMAVARKGIIGAGLGASTVFVISAAYARQDWLAVTLITLCVGSLRLATGSAYALPIDLAPKSMVGTLTSIQSFFGNVGGLLAPIVTGYIVSATGSFVGALVAAGGMALFGAICFVFMTGKLEKPTFDPAAQSPVAASVTAVPRRLPV